MAFEVRTVLGEGLTRTFSRGGLILLVAAYLINIVSQVGLSSLVLDTWIELWDDLVEQFPEFQDMVDDPQDLLPLALDIPDALALAIVAGGIVVLMVVIGAGLRAFHASETAEIPLETAIDNIAWVGVNLLIGLIIFSILWMVGLVLFIIPGILVWVTLIYFLPAVAIEGRSFIGAMTRSWRLTRGSWLSIFLLFLAYFFIVVGVNIAFGLVNSFVYILSPLLGQLMELLVMSLLLVYLLAILAVSYTEMTEPTTEEPPESQEDPFAEFEPADQHAQW